MLAMRKVLLGLSVLPLLLVAPVASAGESSSSQSISTLKAGETVNKDYFAFGDRVEVSGTVNGDVYSAGGFVIIDGTVNGDLLVAGGQVTISGTVTQDVRVGGGQVTISGRVGRNLTIGAGSVEVTDKSTIGGSILAGAGTVTLSAPVSGNVKIGAGTLTIANTINGDVEAAVDDLRLTSRAVVNGKLDYWSSSQASIDSSARVVGEVTKHDPPVDTQETSQKILGILTGFALAMKVMILVTLLLLGLVLLKFFPRFTENTVSNLQKKPLISAVIGFLALILVPILTVVLFVTVIGIPLAFTLLFAYFVALFLTRIFAILLLGQLIWKRFNNKEHQVWSLIIGLLAYEIVVIIPIIGGLVSFFAMIFGLGAALMTKKETYDLARSKNVV